MTKRQVKFSVSYFVTEYMNLENIIKMLMSPDNKLAGQKVKHRSVETG